MLYTSLKLVHVLAVILWFGGGVFLTVLVARAARSSPAAAGPIARSGAALGPYFGACGGVAFLAGVTMVLTTGGLDFDEPWIVVGIVVYLLSAFLGARVIGPRFERLADAVDTGDAGAVSTARSAVLQTAILDVTLLTVAVAAMVYKWGA